MTTNGCNDMRHNLRDNVTRKLPQERGRNDSDRRCNMGGHRSGNAAHKVDCAFSGIFSHVSLLSSTTEGLQTGDIRNAERVGCVFRAHSMQYRFRFDDSPPGNRIARQEPNSIEVK
jgi:hypothetical protein